MKVTRQFKDFFESEIMGETEFNRFKTKTEIRAAGNSTYKKLAVQWLNEALCFVSSSVLADSLLLRNRQLLVAANH